MYSAPITFGTIPLQFLGVVVDGHNKRIGFASDDNKTQG